MIFSSSERCLRVATNLFNPGPDSSSFDKDSRRGRCCYQKDIVGLFSE